MIAHGKYYGWRLSVGKKNDFYHSKSIILQVNNMHCIQVHLIDLKAIQEVMVYDNPAIFFGATSLDFSQSG